MSATCIFIFAVGRGNAAFIRSGLSHGFILDMADSGPFDPASFVERNLVSDLEEYKDHKIAQAVLSHPHTDHIAQCGRLAAETLYPTLLTCPANHQKLARHERIDWSRLGGDDPDKKDLISTYEGLYEKRVPPMQTIVHDPGKADANIEYGIYYIDPGVCGSLHPSDDNKYGNALSMMFYYRHGDHSILFPGDMTPEGMAHILSGGVGVQKRFSRFNSAFTKTHPTWHKTTGSQPTLSQLLGRGLTVLVAPHHGLESCYSKELFYAMRGGKPSLNVLSERRKVRKGDGKTDSRYQSESGASGLAVAVEGKWVTRRSVSTKQGHHILIVFDGSVPRVHLRRDPEDLVK